VTGLALVFVDSMVPLFVQVGFIVYFSISPKEGAQNQRDML
jgi:hypothetical protein